MKSIFTTKDLVASLKTIEEPLPSGRKGPMVYCMKATKIGDDKVDLTLEGVHISEIFEVLADDNLIQWVKLGITLERIAANHPDHKFAIHALKRKMGLIEDGIADS